MRTFKCTDRHEVGYDAAARETYTGTIVTEDTDEPTLCPTQTSLVPPRVCGKALTELPSMEADDAD